MDIKQAIKLLVINSFVTIARVVVLHAVRLESGSGFSFLITNMKQPIGLSTRDYFFRSCTVCDLITNTDEPC